MSFKGYGWYLSSTAIFLYMSNFTHNIVAWLKIAPFFTGPYPSFTRKVSRNVTWVYWILLMMTAPIAVFQVFNNYRYFNDYSQLFIRVRPFEPLYRDPFWIFADLVFFWVIKQKYDLNVLQVIRKEPRFGVMFVAIFLAIIFAVMDLLDCIVPAIEGTEGVNPYWKLSLVFKALADNILIDDFRSVLQRLSDLQMRGFRSTHHSIAYGRSIDHSANRDEPTPKEKIRVNFDLTVTEEANSNNNSSLDSGALSPFGYRCGSSHDNRSQSLGANTVGRVGVTLGRLPRLPMPKDGVSMSKDEEALMEAKFD